MSVQEDTIDRAIELATKGSPEQAVELLRPLVRHDPEDHQALFALAYCYEKADTLTTAVYLYDWIVGKHPGFDVASGHMENCQRELEARGLSEDFEDPGHVACPCGVFRQRAEYGACPYCGRHAGETDDVSREQNQDEDVKDAAVDKIREWAEVEELGPEVEKLSELKEEAESWVKELSETEQAKHITARAGELSREVSERFKKLVESEPVKDAANRAKELGRVASEKVERIIEKPKVQEVKADLVRRGKDEASRAAAWLKSEGVRARTKKLLNAWERVLSKLQSVIDRMKK